jgi:hypothetical protein
VAVWTVVKGSGAAAGFAQGEVAPGESLTLTPVKGYAITVALSKLTTQEVAYDHVNWRKQPAVEVKTSHGTGSTQGTANLQEPVFRVEYGADEKLQSVMLLVPMGSLKSTHLVMPEKLKGTLGELEDCILGATEGSDVTLDEVAEFYGVLHKSERVNRWRQLMSSKDTDVADAAATVLAQVKDVEGTKKFCELCLTAKDNRQIGLLEVLSGMPQSDAALDTMVKLIVAPGTYLLKMPPGVGASDVDRRNALFDALLKYPPEKLKPHAPQVAAWAKAHKEARWTKAVEERVAGM